MTLYFVDQYWIMIDQQFLTSPTVFLSFANHHKWCVIVCNAFVSFQASSSYFGSWCRCEMLN